MKSTIRLVRPTNPIHKDFTTETLESYLARGGIIKKCPYHPPQKPLQSETEPATVIPLFTQITVIKRRGVVIKRNVAA